MSDEKRQRGAQAGDGRRRAPSATKAVPWWPNTPLPSFFNLGKRPVALVDAGEYRALLAMRDALARGDGTLAVPGVVGVGPAGAPIKATFPTRMTVLGADVVAIPATGPRRAALPPGSRVPGRGGRLMGMDKDAEVQEFFLARLGQEDVDHIRQAAVEQFGAGRVPSRSAVNRYVTRLREEQGPAGAFNAR